MTRFLSRLVLFLAGLVLLAGLFVGVVLPWLTGDRSEPVAAESSTTAPAARSPHRSPSGGSDARRSRTGRAAARAGARLRVLVTT